MSTEDHESSRNFLDELVISEDEVVDQISNLEGDTEKTLVLDGVPEPSTLQSLAIKLDGRYEVTVRVLGDFLKTKFFTGGEKTARNSRSLDVGDSKVSLEMHNHPDQKDCPSISDFYNVQDDGRVSLIFTDKGLTEFRYVAEEKPFKDFYEYIKERGIFPWFEEGITREDFKKSIEDQLEETDWYADLDEEEKKRAVDIQLRAEEFGLYMDYMSRNQGVSSNLTREYAMNKGFMKNIPWEDEEAIQKVLRGESFFKE